MDAGREGYYVRNRWYDPEVGRFVSEDPIGIEGGINLYVYAMNDPMGFRDPYGLCVGEQYHVDRTTCTLDAVVVRARRRSGGITGGGTSANFGNPLARGGFIGWMNTAGDALIDGALAANRAEVEKGCTANLVEAGVDAILTVAGVKLLGVLAHRARSLHRNDAAGKMWALSREALGWAGGNPDEAASASFRLLQESRTHAALSVTSGGASTVKMGMTEVGNFSQGAGRGLYEASKWSPVGVLVSGAEAFQACIL